LDDLKIYVAETKFEVIREYLADIEKNIQKLLDTKKRWDEQYSRNTRDMELESEIQAIILNIELNLLSKIIKNLLDPELIMEYTQP
jgi:hypothetical protein